MGPGVIGKTAKLSPGGPGLIYTQTEHISKAGDTVAVNRKLRTDGNARVHPNNSAGSIKLKQNKSHTHNHFLKQFAFNDTDSQALQKQKINTQYKKRICANI